MGKETQHKSRVRRRVCIRCCSPITGQVQLCQKCRPILLSKSTHIRKRLRAQGLCIICQKQARPGKNHCQPCAENYAIQYKKKTETRKTKNLCVTCGKLPPVPNSVQFRCTICYLKQVSRTWLGSTKHANWLLCLFNSQNGKCAYTGRSLILGIDAQLDHILPRSKEGKNIKENVQWLWKPINVMKQNLTEEEFWGIIRLLSANLPALPSC
jgi:5-methylcytosine-specific restriction endonuclease McrA